MKIKEALNMTQEIQEAAAAVPEQTPEQAPAQPPSAPPPGTPPVSNGVKAAAKKRNAKKRVKRIIALVVVLALLAGGGWAIWYFLFRNTVEQGQLLEDVVRTDTIQSKVEGSGNAVAKDMAAITISASGTVQDVYFSQGDQVSEGDVLYSVVSPAAQEALTAAQKGVRTAEEDVVSARDGVLDAQEAVVQAREGIGTAQKNVEKARKGVTDAEKRVTDAEKHVTDAEKRVIEAQEGVTQAQEGVVEAQQALAERQSELARLREGVAELSLTAPFAGVLTSVEDITVGSQLAEGSAVATLANNRVMKLALYFSYAYENDITVGQTAQVSVPEMMLSLSGTVSAVNMIHLVSPEGGTLFEAVIDVPNPGALSEGLSGSAMLTASDGSEIYPYEEGKLAYSETVKLVTKHAGPVTSKALLQYAGVTQGQVLLVQGSDDLDKQISAKQKEIRDAEKGVTSAQKGVESAIEGVETAKEGVETAKEGVETAKEGVESAIKGVSDAEKAVTQAQREVTRAQQRVTDAEQGVLDAQAKVDEAQKALDDLDTVSPISGTITSCTITPGQEVKGGDTVMTISNTTQMSVEIKVTDQNIGFITPGMTVELTNYGEGMWMGIVTKIDMNPSQDNMGSGVTNYPVTLTVDNYDNSLLPGQWLQYSFVASQAENCLVVPTQAVKSAMDEEGNEISVVFLKAESRPDNAVTMPEQSPDMPKKYPEEADGYYAVPVTTGLSDTYNVEIREGLNAGDTVFTNYLSASGNSYGMYG